MKKTLFTVVASAFLLACSSNNAEPKVETETQPTDSVCDTVVALTEFDSLLNCFTSGTDAELIPDRFCYDFLKITKGEMNYTYKGRDMETDKPYSAKGKLQIRPVLMKKSANYVLLVYSIGKPDGGEWIDRDLYLKTLTNEGALIQSMDKMAVEPDGEDLTEFTDYYFKNDSTLYIVHLSPFNKNIFHDGLQPTEENDTASVVELTKYSVLKNGHINQCHHSEFSITQPFYLGEDGKRLSDLVYRKRNIKETIYKRWTEMDEKN